MKKLFAVILVAVLALSLVACGASAAMKEAAGSYKGVHAKFVGSEEWEDEEFSLELKDDGTGTHKRDGEEFNVTSWEIEGENFKMTEKFLGLEIQYTGTLKDGELHLYNGEPSDELSYEYVYKK